MLNSKSLEQLKSSLSERGVKLNPSDNKKSLIEKIWANRDKPNFNYKVKKLRCKHLFHINCLKNWLSNKDNCPNCREKFRKD